MLSAAVRRGDLRYPTVIEDDFNRANSSRLGRTSVGYLSWMPLRGKWSINNSRLHVSTSQQNPLTVVDSRMSDVILSSDISSRSGDGLALRVKDANNYLRIANYYQTTYSTTFSTVWSFICITVPVQIYASSQHHTHDRLCTSPTNTNCCDRGVSFGTLHTHPGAYDPPDGSHGDELGVPQGSTTTASGRSVSYTRRVYLERVENGVVTTLNFWPVSATDRLWVKAEGIDLSVYRADGELVGTHSSNFNQNETKHGIARRATGVQGTRLDNFFLSAPEEFPL